MQGKPACRNCGYDLTGLSLDDVCPECGTPCRPPGPAHDEDVRLASRAQVWGIVSLVLFFTCLGPLAILPASIALSFAGHAERVHFTPRPVVTGAVTTAKTCAWITIVLSSLALLVYAGMLLFWLGLHGSVLP
jgi:hypothetical protein